MKIGLIVFLLCPFLFAGTTNSSRKDLAGLVQELLKNSSELSDLSIQAFGLSDKSECRKEGTALRATCTKLLGTKLADLVGRLSLPEFLAPTPKVAYNFSDLDKLLAKPEIRSLILSYRHSFLQTKDYQAKLKKQNKLIAKFESADLDGSTGRQPSSTEGGRLIRVESVIGATKSVFSVEKSKEGPGIRYKNNSGMNFFRKISEDQLNYLLEKANALPKSTDSIELCRGSYTRVSLSGREVVGCLLTEKSEGTEIDRFVFLLGI